MLCRQTGAKGRLYQIHICSWYPNCCRWWFPTPFLFCSLKNQNLPTPLNEKSAKTEKCWKQWKKVYVPCYSNGVIRRKVAKPEHTTDHCGGWGYESWKSDKILSCISLCFQSTLWRHAGGKRYCCLMVHSNCLPFASFQKICPNQCC